MLSQLPIKMDRDNQILEYNGYKVSYNETHEQSNWVLYKIKRGDFICDEGSERKNRFRDDKDIETGSSHSDDYIRSGYDRGHLKPAGVEPCDQDRIDETFNMVNIWEQVRNSSVQYGGSMNKCQYCDLRYPRKDEPYASIGCTWIIDQLEKHAHRIMLFVLICAVMAILYSFFRGN